MSENVQLVRNFRIHPDSDDDLITAEVELNEAWRADITFHEGESKLVISRIVIAPLSGMAVTNGITADLLRSLKLGKVHAELRKFLAHGPDVLKDSASNSLLELNELHDNLTELSPGPERRLAESEARSQRTTIARQIDLAEQIGAISNRVSTKAKKHTRKNDDFYFAVACAYVALQSNGIERGIIPQMTEMLTGLNSGVTPSSDAVKSWIQAATKRGLLGPGQRGRAGREEGARFQEEFHRIFPDGFNPEEAT
jgi:hypothetical protein